MAQEIIGGGSLPVCNVTPSDMAGQVDNLISRIESLEQSVSELSAANVSANQLSDLSQDAGWITGVTFMGTEGWTQTPFGTLIPPAGWTGLSSIIDGQTGLSIYSGGSVPGGIPATWNSAISPWSNFTGLNYLNFTSGGTGSIGFDNNGDTICETSTDNNSNAALKILKPGVYFITVFVYLTAGTSAPTSGNYQVKLRRQNSGDSSYIILSDHDGHWDSSFGIGDITLSTKRRFDTNDFLSIQVHNWTDGQLQVGFAEIVVEYQYALEDAH